VRSHDIHSGKLSPRLDRAAENDTSEDSGGEKILERASGLGLVELDGLSDLGVLEEDERVVEVSLSMEIGKDLVTERIKRGVRGEQRAVPTGIESHIKRGTTLRPSDRCP
jgi:hypothetical protein